MQNYFLTKMNTVGVKFQGNRKLYSFTSKYTPANWQKFLDYQDDYSGTFIYLEYLLIKTYKSDSSKLNSLISKAEKLEIRELSEFVHNKMYCDLPEFKQFCEAFEKQTGLTSAEYTAVPESGAVRFFTSDNTFKIDTYANLTRLLKNYIDNKDIEKIYIETSPHIWNEIYLDAPIIKDEFIPKLYSNWQCYWNEQIVARANKGESIEKEEKLKATSWRDLEVFINSYNNSKGIVEIANDIEDMELFPLVVLTMLEFYDNMVCYEEYCEEVFFGSGEWESIDINISPDPDETNEPYFYIIEGE
ncbi:MAG: hypothetical protein ACK5LL_15070 [Suipraeoptans sp.]